MAQPEGPSGAIGFQPGARIWGGVARSELLKEVWAPTAYYEGGAALARVNSHAGVRISGVGHICVIELKVPLQFTAIRQWRVPVILMTPGLNTYRVTFGFCAGLAGQPNNFYTLIGATIDVTGNQLEIQDIVLDAYAPNLVADDLLGIQLTYQGAGNGDIATDFVVLGSYLRWL